MTNFQSMPRFFVPRRMKQAFFGGGVLLFMSSQFGMLHEIAFNDMLTTSDAPPPPTLLPSTLDNEKEYHHDAVASEKTSFLTSEHSDESVTEHQETGSKQDYPFTFAGCLLLKDDNQILPEWLAYHYTVLPLRDLIVAVDPLSLTSPDYIFNLYRDIGMNIEAWYGNSYMFDGQWWIQKKGNFNPNNGTLVQARNVYIWRQVTFYTTCLRELKKRGNYTWTILLDSDEYITYNNYQTHEDTPAETLEKIKNGTHVRSKVPQMIGRQNESISHFIASANSSFFIQDKPCLVFPRVPVGSKESSYDKISPNVPDGFNASAFHTLRYRKHGNIDEGVLGKSFIDVSRYDGRRTSNPHRPLLKACYGGPWVHYYEASLRVHHYTGTLETFLSRPGDISRNPAQFHKRNGYKVSIEDDSMRGWLREFVKLVGKEKALEATVIARQKAHSEATKLNDYLQQGKHVNPIYEWN